jgi:hypothetical protein
LSPACPCSLKPDNFANLPPTGLGWAHGSFLSPDEKADFAKELGKALNEARRGPTRTVLD